MGSRGTRGKSAAKPRGKRVRIRRAAKGERAAAPKVSSRNARIDALARELADAREQQAATLEVLRVISGSPGELEPVFTAILKSATRICEAQIAEINLAENGKVRVAAGVGDAPRLPASELVPLDRSTVMGRSICDRKPVHVVDLQNASDEFASGREFAKRLGHRTIVCVPLLHEGRALGTISVRRLEVRPFEQEHITFLTTFAAQAAIAIENARLLNELRQRTDDLTESLKQQTATADVLKVISRSTFDLQAVLDTLTTSAVRLCRAERSTIRLLRGGLYWNVANHGFTLEHRKRMEGDPVKPGQDSFVGRVAQERKPVHVIDAQLDPNPQVANRARSGNTRTMLGVPLLREGTPIGVLLLQRTIVKSFTDKEVALAETFADQAVIAIENVRLFDEIQDKSRQLAEASQHKSQFLASMSHELRTPLNAILGYNELIVDGIYGTPPEKMQAVLKRVESNGKHLLGLINAVLDLSKIEAGQLTLDLGDYSMGDVTQTVFSAVEALAIDKRLVFKAKVAPDLPRGYGDERRLAQVLLNLAGNAIKFTDAGEVVIVADANKGSFNVSVRDTGPGISAADQANLFQEFQQADNSLTRKKGGTGLGLAISKRIIEMHGGRIWIESQLGQGSTFFVTLPVQAQEQTKPPLKQD